MGEYIFLVCDIFYHLDFVYNTVVQCSSKFQSAFVITDNNWKRCCKILGKMSFCQHNLALGALLDFQPIAKKGNFLPGMD